MTKKKEKDDTENTELSANENEEQTDGAPEGDAGNNEDTENDSYEQIAPSVESGNENGKEKAVKRPEPPTEFSFEYFKKQKVKKDDHDDVCLTAAAQEVLRKKDRLNEKHSEKEWRDIIGELTGRVPVGGK